MQHITYNEYLPALLSEEVVSMLIALLDIFHRGPIYVEGGRETGSLNLPPLVILLKALHFRFPPLLSRIPPFSPFSRAKYKTLLSTFRLFIPLLALLELPPPALSSPVSRRPPVHCAPSMGTGGRGNSEKLKRPLLSTPSTQYPGYQWFILACGDWVARRSFGVGSRPILLRSKLRAVQPLFARVTQLRLHPNRKPRMKNVWHPGYSDRPYIELHLWCRCFLQPISGNNMILYWNQVVSMAATMYPLIHPSRTASQRQL